MHAFPSCDFLLHLRYFFVCFGWISDFAVPFRFFTMWELYFLFLFIIPFTFFQEPLEEKFQNISDVAMRFMKVGIRRPR